MNRNKEYRLKRKSQRKDYIIQDKNFTIKTLYYRNETKRNKIEQLEQKNKQLQNNWNELKKFINEWIIAYENNLESSFIRADWENAIFKIAKTELKRIADKMQELEQGKEWKD